MMVSAVRPWRIAFRRDRCLPAAVAGPALNCAFLRFASICRDEVIVRPARQLASFRHDRFSNRPFGVKRFQTIHHHSVDVARWLVLLFGIGTKALPSWD